MQMLAQQTGASLVIGALGVGPITAFTTDPSTAPMALASAPAGDPPQTTDLVLISRGGTLMTLLYSDLIAAAGAAAAGAPLTPEALTAALLALPEANQVEVLTSMVLAMPSEGSGAPVITGTDGYVREIIT